MSRRTLAVPAALLMVASTITGLSATGHAHAHASAASYSGTIAITDWQVPDATIYGGNYGNTVVDQEIGAALVGYTLNVDQSANYVPEFVTQIPTKANGGITTAGGNEVMTLHLKPNLKWSDGSPITHADYVGSVAIAMSPDVNNTYGTDQIQSITFSGNDMVITWKGYFAPALAYIPNPSPMEYYVTKYKSGALDPSLLASYNYDTFQAYSKKGYTGSTFQKLIQANLQDTYNSPNDVFGGPYKLGSWVSDQRYSLVPNTYWNALPPDPQHPMPAAINFVVVSESESQLTTDLTLSSTYSSVDKAEDFQISDLPTLKKSTYQVLSPVSLEYEHLELNQKTPALRDVRVRQALLYGIDKYAYLYALFPVLTSAQVKQYALSSFLASASPWSYNNSLPGNAYNPNKAKALLAAAGYANAPGASGKQLVLNFYTTPAPARVRSAQLLQSLWARLGIVLRLHFPSAQNNGFFSSYADGGVLYRRTFDIAEFAFSVSAEPDSAATTFEHNQIPDATHPSDQNFAGINDPKLEAYFVQGRKETDDATRHQIYDQAQAYFFNQAYWIMLYDRPNIILTKGTIGNFKPNPTSQGNEWNAYQYYVKPAAS